MVIREQLADSLMSRRKFLQMGSIAVVGLAVGACSSDGTATTLSDGTATTLSGGTATTLAQGTATTLAAVIPEKTALTLGINNPNYATQLSVYVAHAKGFFAEEGITDFVPERGDTVIETDEYVAGLIGGSLDLSQGDTDVWFGSAKESGEDIKFLGTYRYKEWQILGVAPGIETYEDLKGGIITGGSRGSRNEFIQRKILAANGIDPDNDVEFVAVGGGSDARLQALLNGQVQGASVFPRHQAALEEAGGQFIYAELTENPQEGIAAMQSWLDENPNTAVAYLTATIKARQFMLDLGNKDEVLGIMRDAGFEIPPDFEDLYDTEIEQISPDAGFSAAEMDELVNEQIELGFFESDVNWRDFVDLSYLWQAQEALGLPRNPASI